MPPNKKAEINPPFLSFAILARFYHLAMFAVAIIIAWLFMFHTGKPHQRFALANANELDPWALRPAVAIWATGVRTSVPLSEIKITSSSPVTATALTS